MATWFALSAMGQGIPEPDIILYGTVKNVRSNANLRLGYGPLTWVFLPAGGGSAITVSTSLTNLNDEICYLLRIPSETQVPGFALSTNAIQLTAAGIAFNRGSVSWFSNSLTFAQPAQSNTTIALGDRGRIERIDLTVSLPVVFDANGLPVDWELLYFGHTGIDPYADPDGDGLNNWAEYRAGTNPLDAASGLRFIEVRPLTGGVRLKWSSAPDRIYALQRSTRAGQDYFDIQTGISSTAPVNTYLDVTATGPGPYFYRLRMDDVYSLPTSSAFKLINIRRDPLGGISIDWLSTAGRTYVVQRSSNAGGGFYDLASGLPATPPVNTYRDASATGLGPYFYRLRLDDGSISPPVALKFVSIQRDPAGGARMDWLSAANRTYTLQRSTNLAAGFANLATDIAATPPANSFRDSNAVGKGPYFYRLKLEP